MLTIKRILCPTDFSECSSFALYEAIMLAKWCGADITGLHVAETVQPDSGRPEATTTTTTTTTRSDRKALTEAVRSYLALAGSYGIRTEAVLKQGRPAVEIVRYAQQSSADLVVMGTNGRGALERFVFGSVTEAVLRRLSCPVIIVSTEKERPLIPGGSPFKTILCPVDFSDTSKQAQALCFDLARETDTRVIFLYVVEILPEWESRELAHFNVPEFARYMEHEALERLRGSFPAGEKECRPEAMVARGRAWREILHVADEQKADLIVMGRQGHGTLERMRFGSTTSHVIRAATCPVLIMPAR